MSTAPAACNLQTSAALEAAAQPKRRSTRLTISIPILVRGTDEKGVSFVEQAQTLVVSLHGAMIALSRGLGLDTPVTIDNPLLKKSAEAVVIWSKQKTGQGSGYEAAVELKEPQDLWGVCFPSRDNEAPVGVITARPTTSANQESPSAAPCAPKPEADSPIEKHRGSEAQTGVPAKEGAIPFAAADPGLVAQQVPVSSAIDSACMEEARERFRASLKELSATSTENVRLLVEAHNRLFNQSLANRALETRDACVKESQQLLAEIERATVERLRKQMELELEAFTKRAAAQASRLAEGVVGAIEARISSIQVRVVPTKAAPSNSCSQ